MSRLRQTLTPFAASARQGRRRQTLTAFAAAARQGRLRQTLTPFAASARQGRLRQTLVLVLSFVICLLTTSALIAQRGGGGAGGGGGFGGGGGQMSRMDLLTERFTLTKDQQKQVKTILDTEYKTAAPIRDLLKKTRTTLGLAIQNKKPQAEIDEAVKGYATQVTAMAEAETKALAKVAQALTPEQRGNAAAMQSAVYMMRGALANKKWDMVPDVWFY